MCGGIFDRTILATCERYDIQANKWHTAPPLNVARQKHSGCCLGTKVYLFCGVDIRGAYLNSIEVLDAEADRANGEDNDTANETNMWRLISPEVKMFPVRLHPLVATTPRNKILIMGGSSCNNNNGMGDVHVFDPVNERMYRNKSYMGTNLTSRNDFGFVSTNN